MAEFEKDDPAGYVVEALVLRYPELRDSFGNYCPHGPMVTCPDGITPLRHSLGQAIGHLEDRHGRKREEVERWLVAFGY